MEMVLVLLCNNFIFRDNKTNTLPMANTAPQLHFDVLLSVAEKLLFSPDNDFRLDLREPTAEVVNFMFAGPACRWAFFTQFRRLIKMSLNLSEIHLSCPTPIQGIRGVLANNKEFFQGPFVISDKFFYVLLCQNVLQPKIVDSFFKFGVKRSNSESTITTTSDDEGQIKLHGKFSNMHDVAKESPTDSLVRVFIKDSPESAMLLDSLKYYNLKLDFVKIQDDLAIFKHIARILNLNAERLLLEITSDFNNCVSKFYRPSITANGTRSVTLSYTIDIVDSEEATEADFPFNELITLLRYIAHSCPNMETFMVDFLMQGEFSDEDFKVLSNWLKQTIEGFQIKGLAGIDISSSLTISFRAFFPETTLLEANKTNHELTKMGEQRLLGDTDSIGDMDVPDTDTYTIARRIQIRDKPPICVVYSLVGIEDENSNNEWDGFNGQLPMVHMPLAPVYPIPVMNMMVNHYRQYRQNGDYSD